MKGDYVRGIYGFADSTSDIRSFHPVKLVALCFVAIYFRSNRCIRILHLSQLQKLILKFEYYRVSSSSVVTPRSSVSRTESLSHFSSSARTPAALPGLFSSVASTARVFLRSVALPVGLLLNGVVEQKEPADSNVFLNHETEQEGGIIMLPRHKRDQVMEYANTDC